MKGMVGADGNSVGVGGQALICGTISPSILNSRIKDLKEADILERTLDGYKLTERGDELVKLLALFGQ